MTNMTDSIKNAALHDTERNCFSVSEKEAKQMLDLVLNEVKLRLDPLFTTIEHQPTKHMIFAEIEKLRREG